MSLRRARYAESEKKAKDLAIIAPWHSACQQIEELSVLFEHYYAMTTSRDRALWRRRHASRKLQPVRSEATAAYR